MRVEVRILQHVRPIRFEESHPPKALVLRRPDWVHESKRKSDEIESSTLDYWAHSGRSFGDFRGTEGLSPKVEKGRWPRAEGQKAVAGSAGWAMARNSLGVNAKRRLKARMKFFSVR